MAVSTQRLMLIILSINMLIGVVGEIYLNPTGYNSNNNPLGTEKQLQEQYQKDYYSETGIFGTLKASADRIYENTIGNVITWGKILINMFLKGINPFSFTPADFTDQIEKMFATVLVFARTLMVAFVMLEGYMLFKNRKTS